MTELSEKSTQMTVDIAPARPGPICELGEQTRELLAELGYSADEIAQLKDAGVVAWPES